MFWLIISVILCVAGFVAIGVWNFSRMENQKSEAMRYNAYKHNDDEKVPYKEPRFFTSKCVLSLLLLLIAIPGFIASVPTGYTGIVTEFGKVLDGTLDAGIHFKQPWRKVVMLDNRTQKVNGTTNAFSSDIQQVDVTYSINYSIDKLTAMTLYKNVGVKYYDIIVAPRLAETMKSAFAEYTAEDLIAHRDALSLKITNDLTEEMEDHGICVASVNVEDIDFTDAFTNAVEAKQVAQQEKLRAQTMQEQAVMEAEAKAKRDKIAAQAEAEVKKLASDAELYAAQNEAKANMALSESITSGLISYMQMEVWDGKLPTVQMDGSSGVFPVIDLP